MALWTNHRFPLYSQPSSLQKASESVQAMTVINFSKAIEMEQNQNIKILSSPTWPDMIFHLVWVPGVKKKKKIESYFKCTRELFYFKKKSYGEYFRKTKTFVKWLITHWSICFKNVDFWSLISLNYLISSRFWLQ